MQGRSGEYSSSTAAQTAVYLVSYLVPGWTNSATTAAARVRQKTWTPTNSSNCQSYISGLLHHLHILPSFPLSAFPLGMLMMSLLSPATGACTTGGFRGSPGSSSSSRRRSRTRSNRGSRAYNSSSSGGWRMQHERRRA